MSKVSPIRWRRVFAVLIMAFALTECGARAVLSQWAGKPYQSLSPYVWSPYGLVRNNPRFTSPAFHISPDGFRDFQDYSPEKPPHTLRVFLIGGSTFYSGGANVAVPGRARVGSGDTIAQFMRKQMQADPALRGLTIEVLNAGVNYNRIAEASAAYLGDFMYWQPDFVIVGTSANDFAAAPDPRALARSKFRRSHPWEAEFERQVNGRGLFAAVERLFRSLQESSAAFALLAKVESKAVDASVSAASVAVQKLAPRRSAAGPRQAPASASLDRWMGEYLAHAGAIASAADAQGQTAVFVWEYFLAHLKAREPFSPEEERPHGAGATPSADVDARFRDEVRDRLAAYISSRGAVFIDPLPGLRTRRDTVYLDHVHYTIEGNEFMAGLIYDSIRAAAHRRASEIRAGNR